jgi:hypothetical protein
MIGIKQPNKNSIACFENKPAFLIEYFISYKMKRLNK